MKKYLKIILFGTLIWLICFIIGMLVWSLHESQFMLFKSIMVVSSTLVGILFIYFYFKRINDDYLHEGLLIGIVWFIVNIILDLLVLVLLLKSPLVEYLISPGIGYLNIPIICTGMGYILDRKTEGR